MNCSKYDRLYPEKAVAPLRDLIEGLVRGIVGPQYGDTTQVQLKDLRVALNASEDNSFPENEPLFLLRGQDELAPCTVKHYAEDVRLSKMPEPIRTEFRARALASAVDMEHWQPRKLPD